jgi:hypothetical protein
VPEGATESLSEIQNELAMERAQKGGFGRFVWIAPGAQAEDERQRRFIHYLRTDPRIHQGTELLETSLEVLRAVYRERLKRTEPSRQEPTAQAVGEKLVYVIYDPRDADVASFWTDFLFQQGLEVVRPVFEGDEAEIREYHEENLRFCEGALILYGQAGECWLRRKLRELQKSAGLGRTKPRPVVAISLIPPRTTEKENFRTHDAIVVSQFDQFSPDPLTPFVSQLKRGLAWSGQSSGAR